MSNALGVNLANGTIGYTAPAKIDAGNGGFPYELTAEFQWHPAPYPVSRPVSPVPPPPGWTTNWNNSLDISGSGLEAMGKSDVRAAVGTIAAFLAEQDIYKSDPSVQRDVAAVLTQAWWAHQIGGNVVTTALGTSSRQFLALPQGVTLPVSGASWIAPGGGFATLSMPNPRVAYEQICTAQHPKVDPYATSRGWALGGQSGAAPVSFAVTNAQGDTQNFVAWSNFYKTNDLNACGFAQGERLSSWTFPQGVTVNLTYGDPGDGSFSGFDELLSVTNTFGSSSSAVRTIDFNGSGVGGFRLPGIGAAHVTANYFPVTNANTITDAAGALTSFMMYPPLAAAPAQRPIPFYNLGQIYTPDKPAAPNTEYDYDSVGHVMDVKDAEVLQVGDRAPYEFYIADGTRGERDDPLGNAWSVAYDTYGHPAQYTDELGNVTLAQADGRGRVTQYTYPEGDQELFQYDDHGNTVSYAKTPKPAYCTPTCPANLTASATWDQTWNKPLRVTNALGNTTTLAYYASGSGESLLHTATRPTVPLGTPVYTFTYDSAGKVLTAIDPDTVETQDTYDGSENLASTILDPGSSPHVAITTTYAYDSTGNTVTTTDPRGDATTSLYDANRRKTEDDHHNGVYTTALLAANKTTYDLLGRDVEDDAGTAFSGTSVTTWQMVKQTAYTPTGKVASVTDGDARVTSTMYDGADRPSIVTDPVLRQSQTIYDAAGNTLQQIRALGTGKQATYATYTYGSDGEKLSVYDADGPTHVTDYSYDAFNRLSSTIYSDLTHEDASYDADGNVLTHVNRAGQTLTYTYDALDRMATKVTPLPADTVTYGFTLASRPTSVADTLANTIADGYDTAGRLTSVATTIPGITGALTTSYTLDAKGNRTKLLWPDGYYVNYTYDALDRMASALENGTFTLATYAYDTLSRRTGLTYRAGMASAYTYSNAGDLLTLDITNNAGALTNYTLGYSNAHELASEASSVAAYVWQPAATGRDNYTAVNTLNQYPSWTPSGGTSHAFSYDANGNMTAGNIAGMPWAFTYDDENRLTTACTPTCSGTPTVDATYAYDPLGRRTEKSGTGVTTTYFLDDGADEIAEYTSAGVPNERYVPGPAVNAPIIKTVVSTGARYYFQTDHHGSVIGIGNSSGAEIEGAFTYDSYGNCFVGTAACSTVNSIPYKFVGMRLDPETGLYYDRARYYSSILGRFPQPDSVGYTSDLNMYAYSGNDPTNKFDPLGLYDVTPCGDNKDCSSAANEFEVQRQANLNSSSDDVVSAAKAWGSPGDNDGIAVTFESQQSVEKETGVKGADANTQVNVDSNSPGTPDIRVSISTELSGKDMGRTIAHEGTHIGDAMKVIKSYDPKTGKFDPKTNYTRRDTETRAYHAGNVVKPYPYHSEQELQKDITTHYANPDAPMWQGGLIQ